jgi:hypothetical protein
MAVMAHTQWSDGVTVTSILWKQAELPYSAEKGRFSCGILLFSVLLWSRVKIGTNNPAGKKWDITNKCVKCTIFCLTNIALNDITGGTGRNKQVHKQESLHRGMLKWIAG